MLNTLRNAWKLPDIRKKMLFTLMLLVIYRLGFAIPVPYINAEVIKEAVNSSFGVLSLMDTMTGGGFSRFNVFGLSVYPYITASIIIQLLTIAWPRLEELSKEGEDGRQKIAFYTRCLGVVLAFVEGYGLLNTPLLGIGAIEATGFMQHMVVYSTLAGGTMFLVWLGDQITEKGIGNGTSIIIFAGIISKLPSVLIKWLSSVQNGSLNIINILLFGILAILVVGFTVAISEGERRIVVQYAKRVVGRKMYGGQSTHIPIKVNMSSVMPVIFTSAILSFPQTLAMFFSNTKFGTFLNYFTINTSSGSILYHSLAVLLIILFAYFYAAVQFNVVENAKNLQQNGGFIPGIRPGRPTSDYLSRILNRVTFIGAISLAILFIIPTIGSFVLGMETRFGGTSILIVVGVVLESIRQMEAMMTMRHYKGFLK